MNQLSKLPLVKIDLGDGQGSQEQEIENQANLSSQGSLDQLEDAIHGEFSRASIIRMLSGVILYNGYGLLKSVSLNPIA
jgi:hypothetical protein